MPESQTYGVCTDAVIAADAVAHVFPIESSQKLYRLDGWNQITFLVKADLGAGAKFLVFDVEGAVDRDGDWFAVPVHDLSNAGAAKDLQVASVTITADTQAALFAIVDSVPYVRVNITNNGENPATVTVWAVVA